ncbi:hypothetical protein ABFY62_23600 [Pseudomonas aeruginosa]|uniref:hypothetical protein n=1 Tax=Pseudomonas aeruginosa TaxID=287 RepID=UPI0038C6C031
MSSTQHQLIEQCAIRLRGIVEALDNIHDTSPHRWSTDLDDVHSSAESLLALIKDQAPARSEASFEEWLANELEGEDGQPVPAAVCDIALARRAFNHWPKLEQPAKVGGVRFSAGVSSRLVVEAAQRLYEFESTPEKEAERIERLQAFREQLDPLNLAPHAEAFNEAPDEALRPEQAEAERPTYECTMGVGGGDGNLFVHGDRASIKAAQHIVLERDAALANVDALAVQVLKLGGTISFAHHRTDQAGQVPQAWLDVQAERRRQITAEGWTPEHDDEHSHGQMARAAACYALAGSSAPNDGTAALLVSLAWPWDEQWWKPSTARRDLVKACALALAEIERLDRAGISQSPQPGATTASS